MKTQQKTKIVVTSDTHGFHSITSIPKCDIFIHCGDFTQKGDKEAVQNFSKWLNNVKAKHKIVVMGNHEKIMRAELPESKNWLTENCPDVYFLLDESVVLENIFFFGHSFRFQPNTIEVPNDMKKVLITHEPPTNILDEMVVNQLSIPWKYFHGGNSSINGWLKKYSFDMHLFGHCHHCYGIEKKENCVYINSSRVTEIMIPWNNPHIIEFDGNEFKIIQ